MDVDDDATVHLLLVYDRPAGQIVTQETFTDAATAIAAYEATEHDYFEDSDRFEVVLLSAGSIEAIKGTHGHYFQAPDDSPFSGFLAAV